jgi:FkbM family methyltransferase
MLSLIKDIVRPFVRPPLHRPKTSLRYVVLGTEYGGWPLLLDLTPTRPIIFSFGVGEDISFDLAAIERFDAQIYAFDPTPRSLHWVSTQKTPENFRFDPIGIASVDGYAEFFPPAESRHVSFSAFPADNVAEGSKIRAEVKRLATIMLDQGVTHLDGLKMDVEGFEYDIIRDIVESEIRPTQLMIEFHHRMYSIPCQRTKDAVNLLIKYGYELYYVSKSGHEYAFVDQREFAPQPTSIFN